MSSTLCIVIVSWNVCHLLRDCLISVYSSPGGRWDADGCFCLGGTKVDVCVVDNASSDDSVDMVRQEFPRVRLIVSERNLGFTGGNNLALRLCRHDYVMLLNPDTELVGNALAEMLAYLETHAQVGVLGPLLRYGDGRLQSSRRRFPTLMMAMMESTLLEQWFPENRWRRAYHMRDTRDDQVQEVDWVTGSCMLVRGQILQEIGLLDEEFFMYSEELDWCRRIANAGWRIVYMPRATVIHHEGKSSSQVVATRHIRFETSKVLFFRKHHGRARAEFLRLFLLATYVWRTLLEVVKFLLGSKRHLRRARIVAYCQLLATRLRPQATRRERPT